MNIPRYSLAGCGNADNALSIGGATAPGFPVSTTERYA